MRATTIIMIGNKAVAPGMIVQHILSVSQYGYGSRVIIDDGRKMISSFAPKILIEMLNDYTKIEPFILEWFKFDSRSTIVKPKPRKYIVSQQRW